MRGAEREGRHQRHQHRHEEQHPRAGAVVDRADGECRDRLDAHRRGVHHGDGRDGHQVLDGEVVADDAEGDQRSRGQRRGDGVAEEVARQARRRRPPPTSRGAGPGAPGPPAGAVVVHAGVGDPAAQGEQQDHRDRAGHGEHGHAPPEGRDRDDTGHHERSGERTHLVQGLVHPEAATHGPRRRRRGPAAPTSTATGPPCRAARAGSSWRRRPARPHRGAAPARSAGRRPR